MVVTLVPPPHWCMCLIWSLRFLIRGHAICLLHQHGPRQFLSEKVLLLCWFRFASCPASLGLAHHHLFRCVAFGVNAQIGGSSLSTFVIFGFLTTGNRHVLSQPIKLISQCSLVFLDSEIVSASDCWIPNWLEPRIPGFRGRFSLGFVDSKLV